MPARCQPTLPHRKSAALFPLMDMDGGDFGELVADIGEHGLLQTIVLPEGRILDGRNATRACRHAGVEVERGVPDRCRRRPI